MSYPASVPSISCSIMYMYNSNNVNFMLTRRMRKEKKKTQFGRRLPNAFALEIGFLTSFTMHISSQIICYAHFEFKHTSPTATIRFSIRFICRKIDKVFFFIKCLKKIVQFCLEFVVAVVADSCSSSNALH